MKNPALQANRQVCDVNFIELATGKPFLFLDTANTTSFQISGDSVNAMARGAKRINFTNPMDNTITLEAQVFPFKLLSLFGDGTVGTSAVYRETVEVTASADGSVDVEVPATGKVETGTVYVYPSNDYGVDGKELADAAFAEGKVSATGIKAGETYRVTYLVNRTGVKKIAINDRALGKDFEVTMYTVWKNDVGNYIPMRIVVHKASIQRNFEMSFASEGDPISISMTLDCLDTDDGNIDLIEIED